MTHHQYTVRLFRDSLTTQWGFRLQGGADLGSQLSVQRVFTGSPAEGELQRGDVILEIGVTKTARLSHKEAEDLIKNAGGDLSLIINRTGPNEALPHTNFPLPKPVIQPQTMAWRPPPRQSQTFGTDYGAQGRGNQANKAMLYNIQHNLDNKNAYPAMQNQQDMGGYGAPYQGAYPGNSSVQYGTAGQPQSYVVPMSNSQPPTNNMAYQQQQYQHQMSQGNQQDGQEEEERERFDYRDMRKKFMEKEAEISHDVQREEGIKRAQVQRQQGPPPVMKKPSSFNQPQQQVYNRPQEPVTQTQPSFNRSHSQQSQSSFGRSQEPPTYSRYEEQQVQPIFSRPGERQVKQDYYQREETTFRQYNQGPAVRPQTIQSSSSQSYSSSNPQSFQPMSPQQRPAQKVILSPTKPAPSMKFNQQQQNPIRVNTSQDMSPTVRVAQNSPYQKATYIPPISSPSQMRPQPLQVRAQPMSPGSQYRSQPQMSPSMRAQPPLSPGANWGRGQNSPVLVLNNAPPTKPRTRRSYAEITLSNNCAPSPRRTSLQRTISQISGPLGTDDADGEQMIYPSYGELRNQFLQKEQQDFDMNKYSSLPRAGTRSMMGTTFAAPNRGARASSEQPAGQDEFTRITPQRPQQQQNTFQQQQAFRQSGPQGQMRNYYQ